MRISTAPLETAVFPRTGKGDGMGSDYHIIAYLLDKAAIFYPPPAVFPPVPMSELPAIV
jgi:hypothetical protein